MILGIDPGLDGALALVKGRKVVAVHDMPTHTITVNDSKRREIDIAGLDALFAELDALHGPFPALVEDPHAMPGQGVSSSFKFGVNCGIVKTLVFVHRIPVTYVRPATWKRRLGLTADKDAVRKRASELFPAAAHYFARKRDDGRAEAVLLASLGVSNAS